MIFSPSTSELGQCAGIWVKSRLTAFKYSRYQRQVLVVSVVCVVLALPLANDGCTDETTGGHEQAVTRISYHSAARICRYVTRRRVRRFWGLITESVLHDI